MPSRTHLKMKLLFILIFKILIINLTTQAVNATENKLGTFSEVGIPPAGSQIVTVGFYPRSAYDIDMADSTFHLHTYIWMRWKGTIDPTETLELINAVDQSDMIKKNILKKPAIQSDGSKYQIMDVESRFNHTFLLDKFPLDSHKLSILLEDTSHGLNQIFYVIDYKNSGYGALLNIPGWLLNNWNAEILSHDYGTSFGDDKGVAGGSIYSTARFDINISRPESYFYWKLLLPLTIVLCGAWIVLLLEPSQIEVRTGLPATALLTTVFLQQSYSDHLPQVGYLVLMDKFYVLAYSLIFITLVRVIFTGTSFDSKNTDVKHTIRIKRGDRVLLILQITVFVIALFALEFMTG